MYKRYLKRIFDVLFSILLLPVVLLIIILFAPIIFLEDRGNPFYNSNRIGKDGKEFTMYKLRTMKKGSQAVRSKDGTLITRHNDDRLLRIGSLLRKTSLDEVPQIINVIKGDMSFIGPRPTIHLDKTKKIDISRKRYKVRPGITGFTQAYYRNSINKEEKYIYDDKYVDNVSFKNDLKILLKTISTVIKKDNIYWR